MRRLAALALLSLAAVPAASAQPRSGVVTNPGANASAGTGAELYAGNCSMCHGAQGEGIYVLRPGQSSGAQTGAGPSLRGVGALAADFYLRTGYMPLSSPSKQPRRERVFFTEAQIDALVKYIASLGKGPPVPKPHPERGNVSAGLKLFTEHCAGCHQVVAEGGYVTNAVAPSLKKATPTQIAEAVRIGPYLMPRFGKGQLTDRQLDSIIRYVQYTKHPDDRGGWAIGHLGPVPEGLVAWLIAGTALVATCLVIGTRARKPE
jgi:ubiquinol-cytochrome c reductase cytochrome c subunit